MTIHLFHRRLGWVSAPENAFRLRSRASRHSSCCSCDHITLLRWLDDLELDAKSAEWQLVRIVCTGCSV